MHNAYEQTSSGTGEVPYYAEETSKTVLRKFPRKVRRCFGSFRGSLMYFARSFFSAIKIQVCKCKPKAGFYSLRRRCEERIPMIPQLGAQALRPVIPHRGGN